MLNENISNRSSKRSRGRPARKDAEVAPEEEILKLALKVFAETGYEGTSIRQLTKDLGVSHGLLHARYGSKENLWKAAIDFGLANIVAQFRHRLVDAPETLDVREKLRVLFEDFLFGVVNEPAILKVMNFEGSRSGFRLDYIASKLINDDTHDLVRLMKEGVKQGVIRDVSVPKVFLLITQGAGAYFALKPLVHYFNLAENPRRNTIQTDVEELADMVLRSITADQ